MTRRCHGRAGCGGTAAMVSAMRRMTTSASLSTLMSSSTQISSRPGASSARYSSRSDRRGMGRCGGAVVRRSRSSRQSRVTMASARPKQRCSVGSCDSTTAPSRVRCTSVSSACAPASTAPRNAARVFSGCRARNPRCAMTWGSGKPSSAFRARAHSAGAGEASSMVGEEGAAPGGDCWRRRRRRSREEDRRRGVVVAVPPGEMEDEWCGAGWELEVATPSLCRTWQAGLRRWKDHFMRFR